MDKQSIQQLSELLQGKKKIFVVSHKNPDGDAIGSAIGWGRFLKNMGHEVVVSTPNEYPDFIAWIEGAKDIVMYSQQPEKVKEEVENADLIFCLDFNALSRINELGECVAASAAKKVMIDHHLDPEDFDDYRLWNVNACSAAQLVYEFIVDFMAEPELINKDVANCLYTVIMTDSGSFRFPNTTAAVHRIVSHLIENGAENARIHQLVYDTSTESRLKFLGHCLSNRLQVFEEYNTSLITVSKEDLAMFTITTGDTEGLVNYGLAINGIRLAALIIERPDRVKLSLRSTGDFPANEICKKYFNGGGHRNAAGGASDDSFEKTIETFKTLLPTYKTLLLQ